MRRAQTMELMLWLAGVFGAATVFAGGHRGVAVALTPTPARAEPISRSPAMTAESLTVLAARVVASDPFRLARHPAATAFRADTGPTSPPADPGIPPKPRLLLDGTVGPPWAGLVEGLPGRDGSTLVRAGDTFGPLVITSVRRDTVIVRGLDTLWRLAVRRAWQ